MSILLALVAALGFGTDSFFAGLASRRIDFRVVSAGAQSIGLAASLVAVLFFSGEGLTGSVLLWGAIAGVGNGAGVMFLYHGLSIGRMSIVATLAGLAGSVLPVLVGLIGGDSLPAISAIGIAIAIPAIALVSWHPAPADGAGESSGAIWGLLAGVCFALFFIALDRAGTDSGAWPVAVNQMATALLSTAVALPVVLRQGVRRPRGGIGLVVGAGLMLGLGIVALQAAFQSGELAIVVVLTSLYPGVTALLARFVLDEHWIKTQKVGLLTALAAVVLVSAGSS